MWAKLVESHGALEASITENVQREDMHPADEFEAFAALIAEGKTVEDDRQPEQTGGLVHHSDRGSQGVFNRSSQHP